MKKKKEVELNNQLYTIGELAYKLYLEGYEDGKEDSKESIHEKYKKAIKVALDKTNTPVSPFFNIVLNELNRLNYGIC